MIYSCKEALRFLDFLQSLKSIFVEVSPRMCQRVRGVNFKK